MSWSPDGSSIIFTANEAKTGSNIYTTSLTGDRKPTALLNTQFSESHGQVSPNGKWLSYQSAETGQPEVYVKPFPRGEGKWQVSTNGGFGARWRSDGRELFFLPARVNGKLMVVDVKTGGAEFQRGTPRELFDSGYVNLAHDLGGTYLAYAVSSDGQRFLIPRPVSNVTQDPSTTPIVVVTNWFEELKQRAKRGQ
jgi:serine/threonine-protein kinase